MTSGGGWGGGPPGAYYTYVALRTSCIRTLCRYASAVAQDQPVLRAVHASRHPVHTCKCFVFLKEPYSTGLCCTVQLLPSNVQPCTRRTVLVPDDDDDYDDDDDDDDGS